MAFFRNANGFHNGHVRISPVARAHLGRQAGQMIILEKNLIGIDVFPHGSVAHVGSAPPHHTGFGQNAVHRCSCGRACKQIDLETFTGLCAADKFPRNQFGIPRGKPGDG